MTGPPLTLATFIDDLADRPVERQLDWLRRRGPVEPALLELIEEAARLTGRDAARADEATALLVALADQARSGVARVRARRARARALCYGGRFAEAIDVCFDAIEIAERERLPVEAGRVHLASMHALGELGRLDDAIEVGRRARETFIAAGEPSLAARADINIGIIHHRGERPAAALACFAQARPALACDRLTLGHLDNSRGESLAALNDFSAAEEAYGAALVAFEAAESWLTAAIVESNLAELAGRQGRLQRALHFYERARRHLDADRSPAVIARLRAEQAETKLVLGLPEEALAEYESALHELDRCGLAIEAARARCGMGQALLRLGRRAAAETALAAAATAFAELGSATSRAKVDLVRAELALSRGRGPEAARLATAALGPLADRPADAAAARHVLARAALAAGDDDVAVADLAAALAAARRLDLAPLLADVLTTRGRLHRRHGRLGEAIDDLAAAVRHIERVRGSLQAERLRAAFLGGRTAAHEALVGAHLDRGAPGAVAAAFAVAEQAKSRSLLDRIRNVIAEDGADARDAADAVTARLRQARVRLTGALNAMYSRLADEQPKGTTGAAWLESVHEHERDLAEVETRLAAQRDAGTVFARPLGLGAVQAALAADEALIEYFDEGDRLTAFVVRADGAFACRHLAAADEVAAAFDRFRFQINRSLRTGSADGPRGRRSVSDARRELALLDAILLRPLRHHLDGIARLTFVPHGVLHLVPFPALWDGERYLVERSIVRTAPSASLAAALREAPAPRRDEDGAARVVVVGVADEQAPRVAAEVDRVAAALRGLGVRTLAGAEATAARVVDALQSASIVHFAGHGRFLRHTALGSGLRLADRWLTVRDVCTLRLQARLVTLSGCETGLSRVDAGDEIVGVQRSFFAAGARALLVSLWQVEDEAAHDLMSRVYAPLAAGPRTASGAAPSADFAALLRDAQLAVMAARPHPAFWAPFVLVGESS